MGRLKQTTFLLDLRGRSCRTMFDLGRQHGSEGLILDDSQALMSRHAAGAYMQGWIPAFTERQEALRAAGCRR